MKKYIITLVLFASCFLSQAKGSLTFTSAAAAVIPDYLPTNGLIAWYPFNGNANDESGNLKHGTVLNGPQLTTDRNGNTQSAYDFDWDGITGYGSDWKRIDLDHDFNLGSTFSFNVWINPETYYWTGNNSKSSVIIANNADCNSNNFRINLDGENGLITSSGTGGFGFQDFLRAGEVSNQEDLNQWQMISVISDGSNAKIYRNGNEIASSSSASYQIMGCLTIGLHRQSNGHWYYFDGKIDDVGIWNRALTETEVQGLLTGGIDASTTTVSLARECKSGNCFDGFGMIIYDNGQEYIGEFKNGKETGYGITKFTNGNTYIGEYKNGLRHGYGVYRWSGGDRLIAKFNNGKATGYAIKTEGYGVRYNYNNPSHKFRILSTEWEEGNLIEKSLKQVNKAEVGCIRGKCDEYSILGGIYLNGNGDISVGKKGNSIVLRESGLIELGHYDTKFSGFFNRSLYPHKRVAFSRAGSGKFLIATDTGYEFKNKTTGNWTSYFYDKTKKKLYLKNWIDNEFVNIVDISEINTDISSPPSLIVENIIFEDSNSNNLLEANEEATISFDLKNTGEGSAYSIDVLIEDSNNTQGLTYLKTKRINILNPKSTNTITIPVSASMDLATGTPSFNIKISEGNGFDIDPIGLTISSQSLIPPNLEIVDFVFSSDTGQMKLGEKVSLQFAIQNIGQGIAEDILIDLIIPENVFAADQNNYSITQLLPGEKRVFESNFFTNKRLKGNALNITAEVSEKYNKYSIDKIMSVDIEEDISNAIALNIKSNVVIENIKIDRFSLKSDVDENIPIKSKVKNRFALIIGNEDYSSHQMGLKREQNVDYAINDAKIFKQYALKTLGVKEEHLIFELDATSGTMARQLKRIIRLTELEKEDAELIIYYAGHGFPDEDTKIPHLIPVDVSGGDLGRAISLHDLYKDLGKLKAKRITVLLDACFTGGGRDGGLIVSRGVRVRPKEDSLNGNLVVFSASSKDQSSLPFTAENHGIFTYHVLKKLQDTKGEISYGDLYDSIKKQVTKTSLLNQGMEQEPNVNSSQKVNNLWRDWKF